MNLIFTVTLFVSILMVFGFSNFAYADTTVTVPSGTSVPGCEETNECYVPYTTTIQSGEEVTWTNNDSAAHTVTSGTPADGPDGLFDSSLFMAGAEYSVKFDGYQPGTYHYFCMVHPWMEGEVRVSSSVGSDTPTRTSVTINTDRSSYVEGETIILSGKVSTIILNTPLTIQIFHNGNVVDIAKLDLARDGSFTHTIIAEGPLWQNEGRYVARAYYGESTSETSFSFSLPPSSNIPSSADVVVARGSSVPGCEETNECYIPYELAIDVGDQVTWYNADSAAHTVTSGYPSDGPNGLFDSSLFMAGAEYSVKFDGYQPGTYHYFCMVHPWMEGVVTVEGTQPPPPPTPASLSISTDKSEYHPGDFVTVNIKSSGSSNVAISVTDPTGSNIVTRSIFTDRNNQLQFKLSDSSQNGRYEVDATSTISGQRTSDSTSFNVKSQSGKISIQSVEPTDQQGNSVSSFSKEKLGFVKVILSSNANTESLVTVNLFDSELTSLGIGSFKTTLSSGQSEIILSFYIPEDAVSGNANIYTNVFSDWPSRGGVPLTGEKQATVRIQ